VPPIISGPPAPCALAAAFPADSDQPANWAERRELLPYTLAAADHAIRSKMELVESAGCSTVWPPTPDLDRNTVPTGPSLERALAIRERVLGPDHPDTATSLNNLALLLQAQGALTAARPLLERALAMSERVQGPDTPTPPYRDKTQFHAEHGRLPRWREWEQATAFPPCAKTIERRWDWRERLAEAIGVRPNDLNVSWEAVLDDRAEAMLAELRLARNELELDEFLHLSSEVGGATTH
jgi:hypothetical protein